MPRWYHPRSIQKELFRQAGVDVERGSGVMTEIPASVVLIEDFISGN